MHDVADVLIVLFGVESRGTVPHDSAYAPRALGVVEQSMRHASSTHRELSRSSFHIDLHGIGGALEVNVIQFQPEFAENEPSFRPIQFKLHSNVIVQLSLFHQIIEIAPPLGVGTPFVSSILA